MKRALGFAVLVVSVALVAATLVPPEAPAEGKHFRPLLPRASLLRVGGRAFLSLVADYYWLQTIQLTGRAKTAEEYRDIADYAQLVTDLDPDFAYVYQFGSVVVPFNYGRETWVNTAESTALLEKALARVAAKPGTFSPATYLFLRILLAYNYSVFQKEYARAAHLLEETARLPGAPPYLPFLTTRLYAQAGSFDAADAFATQFATAAADPDTRAAFERRKDEIALERILRTLDEAVASYRQREGRLPAQLVELVSSGLVPAVPEDPLGGRIYLGEDGRTYSTSQEHRLQVYEPLKDEKR
ncbi:MAG TPA: hypothetical protein VK454_02145 [Myxococcaceae bacterium]|nr:hypothetical protein [Myxococcaceae bacterium]